MQEALNEKAKSNFLTSTGFSTGVGSILSVTTCVETTMSVLVTVRPETKVVSR